MKVSKRVATLVSTGALLAASFVGGTATSASAAGCGGVHVVKNNSDGYGTLKGSTPVRTAPYEKCPSKSYKSGSRFYYWCYENNDYGNKWIFGRIAGTSKGDAGWVYAPNIKHVKGSLKAC